MLSKCFRYSIMLKLSRKESCSYKYMYQKHSFYIKAIPWLLNLFCSFNERMDQEWSPIFRIFEFDEHSLHNVCFCQNFYIVGNITSEEVFKQINPFSQLYFFEWIGKVTLFIPLTCTVGTIPYTHFLNKKTTFLLEPQIS